MDRKEFFIALGKGTAAVCMACYLASCANNGSSNPTAPTNVDFTLDLTQATNQSLNTIGGYIYKDGVIVGRASQDTFVAVSQYCTHQGSTVQYDQRDNLFHCPAHGSNFHTDGSVINGPAASPLMKYNTEFTGNTVRVFS